MDFMKAYSQRNHPCGQILHPPPPIHAIAHGPLSPMNSLT
jgi:hypothetical protein